MSIDLLPLQSDKVELLFLRLMRRVFLSLLTRKNLILDLVQPYYNQMDYFPSMESKRHGITNPL
jgi:hypothetical protein